MQSKLPKSTLYYENSTDKLAVPRNKALVIFLYYFNFYSSSCIRWVRTLVVGDALGPIPLVVGGFGGEGTVDGDLVVVGSQTVTVGVRVGEQTALQEEKQVISEG